MDTSWTELHVGIRMHHELQGMIFSDYSFGVGVPFFSTDSHGHNGLGASATHVLGHPEYREVQLDFTPEMVICCLRDVILKMERDLSNII